MKAGRKPKTRCAMLNGGTATFAESVEMLGDFHPLVDQLGSTEGLMSLDMASEMLRTVPVRSVSSLYLFLSEYQDRLLVDRELPSIRDAFAHAKHHQVRELVSLDCRLSAEDDDSAFACASRRIGQWQLRRLRPLRDQRTVQRYLRAVEQGDASGWHTLVYGLTLEIYSLPLRQGLIHYGDQALRGFLYFAGRRLQLAERQCRAILAELSPRVVPAVEKMLRSHR